MKAIKKSVLTAIGCAIIAIVLPPDCKARSTALTSDEFEMMRAARDQVRWTLFYARWKQTGEAVYPFPLDDLKLLSSEELPKYGTYWSRQRCGAPLPFNPFAQLHKEFEVDVYALPDGTLLLDDMEVDYAAWAGANQTGAKMSLFGESGSESSMLRTAEQFAAQRFSLIDTNDAALNDTNLYNAIISFPEDTNTVPMLQITQYGTNAVIIKANHFDYSSETDRDFALLVCESVDKPLWKNVDLSGSSDAEDGWLIQGLVPNWKVADPMFFLISNTASNQTAFFRAIPYSGPQVVLTGANPYDTVSNTIALHAAITDLSGTTNQRIAVLVNGLTARYTLGTNNTLNVDTRYSPSGSASVDVSVANENALIQNSEHQEPETKRVYSTTLSLPLTFDNPTFVASSGDMASPEIGTNYILIGLSQAQAIEATISDPSSGRIVRSYSGYMPGAGTAAFAWAFNEADGVTAYTNDTYAVSVQADTLLVLLNWTNTIDRQGVRDAAGAILTYEEEYPDTLGSYLNSELEFWGDSTALLYETLYDSDWLSIPQYTTADIGLNRDNPSSPVMPFVLNTTTELSWKAFLQTTLTNRVYSDFNYGPGHGSGSEIGGSPSSWFHTWVQTTVTPFDLNQWALYAKPAWRIRKAAIWACYSGNASLSATELGYMTWPEALGIRSTGDQLWHLMMKNAGLFFEGKYPQGGYGGSAGITSAEVATTIELLWVYGPNGFPGGCDPTYAFQWAAYNLTGMFPELDYGDPVGRGYPFLPYTGVYDRELLFGNTSHVKGL